MDIGEKKGKREANTARKLLGFWIIFCRKRIGKINSMVTGKVNCCASWILSTVEPAAAKREPYRKNPPKKKMGKKKLKKLKKQGGVLPPEM